MFSKVNILITLVAAVIMALFCVITYVPFQSMCIRLIVTILIFFIIGSIAQHILIKQHEREQHIKEQILSEEPDEEEKSDVNFDDFESDEE